MVTVGERTSRLWQKRTFGAGSLIGWSIEAAFLFAFNWHYEYNYTFILPGIGTKTWQRITFSIARLTHYWERR
jgi:hypothetical protein